MEKLSISFKIITLQLLFIFFFQTSLYAQDIDEILANGEAAFSQGKYLIAEKNFKKVLEKDPDNYKVLRAQADTKIQLKKEQNKFNVKFGELNSEKVKEAKKQKIYKEIIATEIYSKI